MNCTVSSNSILREVTKAFLGVVMLGAFAAPALAQPWPGFPYQGTGAPGGPVNTARTPLIDGAPNAPAMTAPPQDQPPPIGDGDTPAAVNPGMGGAPTLLPWVPAIPANSIDQTDSAVNLGVDPTNLSDPGVLGPSLTGVVPGPQSTLGVDPGDINGSSGGVGLAVAAGTISGTNSSGVLPSPVATGNINAGGGLPNLNAPIARWAAQRSYDYGNNQNVVNNNASGYDDFGQLLPNMPNLKMQPQFSQDGPRPLYTPTIGQPVRAPNMANAQATTSLYGNRMKFNPNYQSNMTIAPY